MTDYLPARIDDLGRFAEIATKSGIFNGSVEVGIVKLMAGASWGVPPFVALREIDIIQGRPAPGANLQRALIRRYPNRDYRMEDSEPLGQWCEIRIYDTTHGPVGPPNDEVSRGAILLGAERYTWERAERAGYTRKDNWKRMGPEMLRARATSSGARAYCPEVLMGSGYCAEELRDMEPAEFVSSQTVEPRRIYAVHPDVNPEPGGGGPVCDVSDFSDFEALLGGGA